MATTKNITKKQFNGTDYDTLYPKTIAEQVDGVYSKDEVLSNGTKALYGLTDSAVPDDVFTKIGNASFGWKLIKSYKQAGTYTFVVPNGITEIGIYEIGAGGSGAANTTTSGNSFAATGGAAGYGKNFVLNVTPGQEIPIVIGAGGVGVNSRNNGNKGGTTSVNGVAVEGGNGGNMSNGAAGGQGSYGTPSSNTKSKLYGSIPTEGDTFSESKYTMQNPLESQNKFDPFMVTLCAGGGVSEYGNPQSEVITQEILAMPDGTKGGDGLKTQGKVGIDATGNGNGGGGIVSSDWCTSGKGSDGAVFIYARSAAQ